MSVSDAPPGEPSVDERRGAKLSGRSPLAAALGAMAPPLDLRILGRTLLHTAAVGLAAGLLGVAFFAGLEYTQSFLLEHIAGYTPLRAHGERIFGEPSKLILRPAVILILPAAGALLAGLLCMLAPETRGGGGDAMIHAFHHQGGVVRRRVIWIKALASILTLGSGGSGGREGPTMQMGGALGSWVGLTLKVSARERRILMLAGVAAGMAAVFRTPLGAALLAAEVLYRDDFEAEALVPAVLASVISYSVVISIFGESILFAHATRYPFVPKHLPRAAGRAGGSRRLAVSEHAAWGSESVRPAAAADVGAPGDRRARLERGRRSADPSGRRSRRQPRTRARHLGRRVRGCPDRDHRDRLVADWMAWR